MLTEWVAALPSWLVVGLVLGGVASAGVALLFAAGQRYLPGSARADRSRGERVDGTARRRAEIRQYLGRIDERYAERVELGGRRVAFHLPERDVAITFDPQTYFGLANADGASGNVEFDADPSGDGLYVILIEQEMPGHHLGRRLPFEVADVHLGPEDAPDPVAEAFDTLGLEPTADADSVEAAYRDRVVDVHPDQGGDRETFSEVQEAYATALNHVDGAD
ncbi:J domain-containing protein [Halobaculum sp. MBLA0147]|uniref:J domain-containing protein n=1 Tax=Halobaculum sp. MBLA0147 TaxID=3079934 RepID=UPI0035255072